MAKVKYRIREFKPTANQTGGHSVYAEAVVDNIITIKDFDKEWKRRRANYIKRHGKDCV